MPFGLKPYYLTSVITFYLSRPAERDDDTEIEIRFIETFELELRTYPQGRFEVLVMCDLTHMFRFGQASRFCRFAPHCADAPYPAST